MLDRTPDHEVAQFSRGGFTDGGSVRERVALLADLGLGHLARNLFKLLLFVSGHAVHDDLPEPTGLGTLVAMQVGIRQRAQGEATGQRAAFVEVLAGRIQTAFDLEFERAAVLNGRRGPVLQRGGLAVGFPDMLAADQRAARGDVQAV